MSKTANPFELSFKKKRIFFSSVEFFPSVLTYDLKSSPNIRTEVCLHVAPSAHTHLLSDYPGSSGCNLGQGGAPPPCIHRTLCLTVSLPRQRALSAPVVIVLSLQDHVCWFISQKHAADVRREAQANSLTLLCFCGGLSGAALSSGWLMSADTQLLQRCSISSACTASRKQPQPFSLFSHFLTQMTASRLPAAF